MIFCGDIAIPSEGLLRFDFKNSPIVNEQWIGNLEGSLITEEEIKSERLIEKRVVFNSLEAIINLKSKFNFVAFNLGNNHIFDVAPLSETINYLNKLNISYFGAGNNIKEAAKPFLIEHGGTKFAIISYGWELIKCKPASKNNYGVNPYNVSYVKDSFLALKEIFPDRKFIVFFHWNIELEEYPQPMDRELSHWIIDNGGLAVVGCHSHRVQQLEIYNNRPIMYGLGNFAFPQDVFMDGKLKYPDFSAKELLLEIKDSGDFTIHQLSYHKKSQTIEYDGSVNFPLASYSDLSEKEYNLWFKKNRYQKKGISIFYYSDSNLRYKTKILIGKLRNFLIDILVKSPKIFNSVKIIAGKIYKQKTQIR